MGIRQELLFDIEEYHQTSDVVWTVATRVINGGVSFLVADRLDGTNRLTFPGGKIEIINSEKEDPRKAAVREWIEETKTNPPFFEAHEIIDVFDDNIGFFTSTVFYSLVKDQGLVELKQAEPEKLGPWRWVGLEEIEEAIEERRLPDSILTANFRAYAKFVSHTRNGKIELPAGFMRSCVISEAGFDENTWVEI